ncbi:MAG: hypothetical protein RJB25_333 [Bacteroidota bacterium]
MAILSFEKKRSGEHQKLWSKEQIKNPVTHENYWVLLWGLTGSNRRPSACKADALNQLS